jgi:flagellar motor switch protein FliG
MSEGHGGTVVASREVSAALKSFVENRAALGLHVDSGSYLRAVLNKALAMTGPPTQQDIAQTKRITAASSDRNQLEATEVVEIIHDEHPHHATLLVHMDRLKAAEVLRNCQKRVFATWCYVATFGGAASALKEIDRGAQHVVGKS